MNQRTKANIPPCVLGIVDAGMLASRRVPDALWACGGVELRADGLPPDELAAAVADFDTEKTRRGFAGPVFLTLRLVRDGGAWPDADAGARAAVWESLPPGTCDWVDIEIEEYARTAPAALDALRSSGVKILLSHHAFTPEEPADWEASLAAMRAAAPPADGVKFAVALRDRAHALALTAFARRVGSEYPQSCVFGMGAAGTVTRVTGPLLGCPYTYGYLGETAVAPGQLSAPRLRGLLSDASRPPVSASDTEWLDWADALVKKVTGA